MGEIAQMMIEAEMAGMDYAEYCVEVARLELARAKKAKKPPVARPQAAKENGK